MKKHLNQNVIFTGLVLLAALALALFLRSGKGSDVYAHLQYDTTPAGSFLEMEIPLEEDARYDLPSGQYTIHLVVKDGAIAFVESPCPDHLCEHYGWLDKEDDFAACLPAGAVVTIKARG
ncbi:MAG: NusG domain II-containing protein [Oscillospiraceae bacterium]|nr:NusG domain II-containing protein [Oscillospiraceae bacterium]